MSSICLLSSSYTNEKKGRNKQMQSYGAIYFHKFKNDTNWHIAGSFQKIALTEYGEDKKEYGVLKILFFFFF